MLASLDGAVHVINEWAMREIVLDCLNEIFPFYAKSIDDGYGQAVAASFQAAAEKLTSTLENQNV